MASLHHYLLPIYNILVFKRPVKEYLQKEKLSPLSVSGIFTSEIITAIYPTPVTIDNILEKIAFCRSASTFTHDRYYAIKFTKSFTNKEIIHSCSHTNFILLFSFGCYTSNTTRSIFL
jgi:hypothetical protein